MSSSDKEEPHSFSKDFKNLLGNINTQASVSTPIKTENLNKDDNITFRKKQIIKKSPSDILDANKQSTSTEQTSDPSGILKEKSKTTENKSKENSQNSSDSYGSTLGTHELSTEFYLNISFEVFHGTENISEGS